MKVLYAIQGTGNGHIARAGDVVPVLRKYVETDLFVSGAQADITLPFDIKYRSKGLSFYFGKSGGVDLIKTIQKNKSKDTFRQMREFPVGKYDLVINDFEPISAWAAKMKHVPCVALSHQASLLSPEVPRPGHYDPVGHWILKQYAPANAHVGLHFKAFNRNIFTPVIRASVRNIQRSNNDHYTVYLPAYDDKKLLPLLSTFPDVRWHIFSKHSRIKYSVGKISVFPVSNDAFTASLAASAGVLCGAGFETPAEAMFLGKKLMVVPMKKQYEQHYNAAALALLGVPVLKKMKRKYLPMIREWIEQESCPEVEYPDVTEKAVLHALSMKIDP